MFHFRPDFFYKRKPMKSFKTTINLVDSLVVIDIFIYYLYNILY